MSRGTEHSLDTKTLLCFIYNRSGSWSFGLIRWARGLRLIRVGFWKVPVLDQILDNTENIIVLYTMSRCL